MVRFYLKFLLFYDYNFLASFFLLNKGYILIYFFSYLEKAMAPHSWTLAWKIPWMEDPGRPQSMGSLRVGRDWVTSLSLSCIGEGQGNPVQCSCLENPRDGGACWAAVYGVAQSRTRLKRLRSILLLIYVLWKGSFVPGSHSNAPLFRFIGEWLSARKD